ncbi:MAG TPA: TetR/AcrR family transcriptional regulator [Solirubrobacterales bacterium]|nr:TetR/AcrR family transcriptional regulator [Solirubrobacterales bacterium]
MAERDARERILEAACDLIAADGIDDVRIARVAMRAGASTALVHHYFSTREELLEQALLHSFEQAADDRFAEGSESSNATAALAEAIEDCLPVAGRLERDWVLWVELWLRAAREPGLRPLAASLYGRYHEWLEDVLKRGIDSGEFTAPADLPALTDRTMALLDGLGLRALLHDPTMDIDAARAQVADFVAPQLGLDPSALLAKTS